MAGVDEIAVEKPEERKENHLQIERKRGELSHRGYVFWRNLCKEIQRF